MNISEILEARCGDTNDLKISFYDDEHIVETYFQIDREEITDDCFEILSSLDNVEIYGSEINIRFYVDIDETMSIVDIRKRISHFILNELVPKPKMYKITLKPKPVHTPCVAQ